MSKKIRKTKILSQTGLFLKQDYSKEQVEEAFEIVEKITGFVNGKI